MSTSGLVFGRSSWWRGSAAYRAAHRCCSRRCRSSVRRGGHVAGRDARDGGGQAEAGVGERAVGLAEGRVPPTLEVIFVPGAPVACHGDDEVRRGDGAVGRERSGERHRDVGRRRGDRDAAGDGARGRRGGGLVRPGAVGDARQDREATGEAGLVQDVLEADDRLAAEVGGDRRVAPCGEDLERRALLDVLRSGDGLPDDLVCIDPADDRVPAPDSATWCRCWPLWGAAGRLPPPEWPPRTRSPRSTRWPSWSTRSATCVYASWNPPTWAVVGGPAFDDARDGGRDDRWLRS